MALASVNKEKRRFSIKHFIPLAAALLYFLWWTQSTPTISQTTSTNMTKGVDVGSPAPDLELPDAKGNTIKLSDYKGKKNVVIFFYPKSFTYGCTRENIAFGQNYNKFTELDTEVIGVSQDEVSTQDKFSCEHNLPFVLLSDKGSQGAKAFGVTGDFFGMIPGRTTFVINKEGNIILKHNSALKWNSHIEESLAAVKKVEGK